jgi:hypothetical protein
MKKCLHLKKTKPHWRRKPPKVVTWMDRVDAERRERKRQFLLNPHHRGALIGMAAMSGVGMMGALSELLSSKPR